MKAIRFRLLWTVLFAMSMVLSACSSSNSSFGSGENNTQDTNQNNGGEETSTADKYGGKLRIITTQDLQVLGHPPSIRSISDNMISGTALETLGRYDEKGVLQPFLAESFDSDPQTKTITIKLRQGITFHDGTVFDAEAVRWNLEQYRLSKKPIFNEQDTSSIEVVDDNTVRINLNTWDINILESVGTVFMASPTAIQQNGDDWAKEHPVGTGPFVFDTWEKNVSVTFKKNENYWQEGKPYLDEVEWKIIADSATAEAALQANEADVYYNTSPRTAKMLESTMEVVKFEAANGGAGAAIYPDGSNPDSPWAKEKVRQALTYAIDRQALVDAILLGYGIPTNQYSIPGSWSYSSKVTGSYDKEKAKQLLAEAGYPNGFATTLTVSNNPDSVQLYTGVQSMLQDVGIVAQLNVVDIGKFQEMTGPNGSWEGLIGYILRVDNDPSFNMIRNFGANGTNARSTARVAEFEQLLADSRKVTDQQSKQEMTLALQEMAFEKYALATPLYISISTTAKQQKVKDDGIHKTWMIYWTPENAWIEK